MLMTSVLKIIRNAPGEEGGKVLMTSVSVGGLASRHSIISETGIGSRQHDFGKIHFLMIDLGKS